MNEQAATWVRVSTAGQDEASQLPDIARWCDQHAYEVTRRYTVHGKSAYKGKHQAMLDQAFADMSAGVFTVLVVWVSDRIERRGSLALLTLADRARQAGGRIEYVKEAHLNATNDMSDTMLALAGDMARMESKRKSERVTIKQQALRAAGSAVGRPAWGYEIQPVDGRKLFVPTADGRKYIPRIYARVIEGESLRSIAAWLTAEGVITQDGNTVWNEGYLGNRLVKNPVYYGHRVNGGQIEVEELVSASTWQQAQAALKTRVRGGRAASVHVKALLKPLCGACQSPMYRVFTGKNRVPYYRCYGKGPQRKGCGNMILLSELDATVTEAMLADEMNPHVDRVFIAGDDNSDAIAKLQERIGELARNGDYQAVTKTMAEIAALEAEPSVKPHWETKPTGQTEAEYFESLTLSERREYLSKMRITASAGEDYPIVTIAPMWADEI